MKLSTESPTNDCPQCGAALPEGTLQGLCPRCVARQAAVILAARSHAPSPSTLDSHLSTTIRYFGDYELLEEIAHGGMGVVWKARQVSLNRTVAVKMLLAGRFSSPEFVQRFRTEAEAAANLQHPNIVAIHEVGEHEGQQYFSMDYVDGQSLAERARENPLPPELAADYVRTIAEAIHYAHQRGILHRDLKPSNVLIDAQDHPRVTDFGLAKRLTSDPQLSTLNDQLTITGQVLGTPGFMPPEQAGGRKGEVGVYSDVYSLGALLYFLLTGRAPFVGDSLGETLRQVHELEPGSPRLLNPAVPRDLETICLKCLEKEPHKRYAAAHELAEELGRFLNGETICARPASRPEKLWRWCRRKPALAAALALLLLVVAGGLTGILWQWRRAETNAARAEQHATRETAQRVRAEEAVTSLELQRVEDLLEKDEVVMGMAYLARIVRQQPTNRIAAQRLLSALTQRNFALPIGQALRHDKRVWYAEFSPDGRRVATASSDFTARVWDARTGESLTAPMLHSNTVGVAHFSPDGERILTFADDFRACLWEADTGRGLGQPMAHTGKIHSTQFSPDGRRVLTASDDGTARVWAAQTGEPVLEPLRHGGAVNWARFSPDGQRIVTASADKTAQLWDAQTGQAVGKPLAHRKSVEKAEFSPNGKWIVTVAQDFSTCVWDVTSGEPLAKPLLHGARIETAKFSPDGERIIVPLANGTTRIFNARDWTPLTQPMQHRGGTSAAEFGPEAQRVLTASLDNTARLWDVESGEALSAPIQHDGLIWHARFSPDGLFAVTASADMTARIWDVRLGGTRSQPMIHAAPVKAAEFSPDGEWVATASQDRTARIWQSRTGQQQTPALQHSWWVLTIRFSPDGERVATGSADGTARIWDARTGQPLTQPMVHGAPVDHIQFSPDGQMLATASLITNRVLLWKAGTGRPCAEPIPHSSSVHVLSFSPDGRWLLLDDFHADTGEIRDVQSGRLLVQLRGHEGYILYGEFSPDGQRVLTASEDGTARIWDAHTGKSLVEPLRHKNAVQYARFSRDGRHVVTASDDATGQLWDSRTGRPVGEPLRHRDWVRNAEFSPDGALVVTASRDGTARLWDARTGRPVAEAYQHRGEVISARFSPDGRRVLTASHSDGAHVWDVPPAISSHEAHPSISLSSPNGIAGGRRAVEGDAELPGTLLADLAESVIGKRVNAQGALESVAPTNLPQVRQRVSGLPRDADFTRWLEWFFADRTARAISPYSQVLLPDYVWSRAKETNQTSWREALMLCPTNGYAFAQLAKHYLLQSKPPGSSEAAQADWSSRQAVKFAPWDWWSWHRRMQVVEHTGAWTNLLTEAEDTLRAQAKNHYAWNTKARALRGLQQFEAAVAAYSHALEIGERENSFQTEPRLRRDILFERANVLRRLGRLAQASADNAAALGLSPRDPQAGPNLIDLGMFYNGGWDEGYPGGIQLLAGTDFDLRGWVHLDLRLVKPEVRDLPERVNAIPIGRQCRRLHFLHTASYASYIARASDGVATEKLHVPFGAAVGHYFIHYADGQQVSIPILHGRDVRDYFHNQEHGPDDPALVVAWTGSTTGSRRLGATTRLYKSTWENPRPDVPIHSLDFVHAKTHAVPILVALTAEP